MTDERPLNVRVAAALGIALARYWSGVMWSVDSEAPDYAFWCLSDGRLIPPYGEESPEGWACTGPLIAERRISIEPASGERWKATDRDSTGSAWARAYDANPLAAACEVIIAMKGATKE